MWGATGVVAYSLNQDNAIYNDSTWATKITLQVR